MFSPIDRLPVVVLFVALAYAPLKSVQAQTPVPLPNPNLSLTIEGTVFAMARQADGGVIIGGDFSLVNGQGRSNIARLKPDGMLDATWKPSVNDVVLAVAVDAATGAAYASGFFTSIDGQNRRYIAKLSGGGAGTVDSNWNPSANGRVTGLALDGSGNVYASGSFSVIGGQNRVCVAKLSGGGTGSADANWNPSCNGEVKGLAGYSSGVYVFGSFTAIGGRSRAGIAKLPGADTGVADNNWNPSPVGEVLALTVDGSGNVYAGGAYTSIGGQSRSNLARLSGGGTGAADATWNPPLPDRVSTLALDGAGYVYASGGLGFVGSSSRQFIVRLSESGPGNVDANWNAYVANGEETPLVGNFYTFVANAANVYVGGRFAIASGERRSGFAVLSGTGSGGALPIVADVEAADGSVHALARQPNGGVIVGGRFLHANGRPRGNLLRLRPDGSLDPDWNPSADNEVDAIAVDASGNVYAGGWFTHMGGMSRARIAKLAGGGTGATDVDWDPSADDRVTSLVVNEAGDVYAGGWFLRIGGQARARIAKLSSSGSGVADAIWDASASWPVNALALDGDGNVFAGGWFHGIGGQSREGLAKLSGIGIGAADAGWNPSPDGTPVNEVLLDGGNVYVAGNFTSIGGQSRGGLAKLAGSGAGAADVNWNPSPDDAVYALASDRIGNIYAGGWFGSIGGQNRSGIAKLSANGVGAADASWNPIANSAVSALSSGIGGGPIHAGGGFSRIGGQIRTGLALLPGDGDVIFRYGFD